MQFNEFLSYLKGRLRSVSLGCGHLKDIDVFLSALWEGKFLRARMAFLAARQLGLLEESGRIADICVGIEVIHLASLLHDDIMDKAETRRGLPCFYKKFSVGDAIVVGDFLFGVGERHISRAGAIGIGGEAIEEICRGQLLEEKLLKTVDCSMQDYLLVAEKKTASLFEKAVMAVEALVGKGGSLSRFAKAWGVGFQLYDDLLDIKEDFLEKKFSFPVIMLRELMGRGAFEQAFNQGDFSLAERFLPEARALTQEKLQAILSKASGLVEAGPLSEWALGWFSNAEK